MLEEIPSDLKESGVLKILMEEEWRSLGITQSLGWEHYEVHAPEPHILLFKRPKNYGQVPVDYATAWTMTPIWTITLITWRKALR